MHQSKFSSYPVFRLIAIEVCFQKNDICLSSCHDPPTVHLNTTDSTNLYFFYQPTDNIGTILNGGKTITNLDDLKHPLITPYRMQLSEVRVHPKPLANQSQGKDSHNHNLRNFRVSTSPNLRLYSLNCERENLRKQETHTITRRTYENPDFQCLQPSSLAGMSLLYSHKA